MTGDTADSPLVTIATFISGPEADVARTALEAAGIEAFVRHDDCGGTRPSLWLGGIQLLVRRDAAAEAAAILRERAEPLEEPS